MTGDGVAETPRSGLVAQRGLAVLLADRRVVVASLSLLLVGTLFVVLGSTSELWVDHPTPKADSALWRLSTALAIAAVVMLAVTLSLGPVRVLAGRRPAVHLPVRRTLGVAAAALGFTHVLVALNVHGTVLRPWQQLFTAAPSLSDPITVLRNSRGYANWVGLAMIATLALLAFLSRRSWLTRLGPSRWKLAQRSLYVVFAAVALHAILYWRAERRLVIHQVAVLTPMLGAAALQVAGAIAVWRRRAMGRAQHG